MDKIRHVLDRKGRHVESIAPEATVSDAVALMNACKIGSVLVGDLSSPLGIFSERDVLARVVAAGRNPKLTRVCDVMTRELVMIAPDVTVEEAMAIVTEHRCRHLPVVDGNRVCGLISAGDLTKWVVFSQRQTIADLHSYIRAS